MKQTYLVYLYNFKLSIKKFTPKLFEKLTRGTQSDEQSDWGEVALREPSVALFRPRQECEWIEDNWDVFAGRDAWRAPSGITKRVAEKLVRYLSKRLHIDFREGCENL